MSIKENQEKIKAFLGSRSSQDIMTVIILVLVALGSFGLGMLMRTSKNNGITIIYPDDYKTMINDNSQSLEGEREGNVKGSLSSPEGEEEVLKSNEVLSVESSSDATKLIVASKRGTKYYYSWCTGAKNLSEANKVYFSTEEEAISAGYSKSTSCK